MEGRARVLFMPHHFRQPSDQGGLRSWHLVNQLKETADIEVVVPGVDTLTGQRVSGLTWRLWRKERFAHNVSISRVNALPNIRTSKIGRALYYASFSTLQLLRACVLRNIDVVVVTSMPASSMLVALLAARIHRAKLVIDVRDLPTDLAVELGYFRKNAFSRGLQSLERFVYRRADVLVAVSAGMARILEEKLDGSRSVDVCPIGFDDLVGGSDARELEFENGLSGKFVVLYSGTMGYVVDVDTVLDAARLTRDRQDILYLFVGDGQRLQEYRERSRAEDSNCLFAGRIPKATVSRVCARADVCVYPLVDGRVIAALLGNKIFDYMGAGKPTLYTGPEGDVSDLVARAGAGICMPPGDASSLARQIIDLSHDTARCEEMGASGRRFVMDGLTARHTTSRMAKLIVESVQ